MALEVVTGDQASGGARRGVADPVMTDPATLARTVERTKLVREVAAEESSGVDPTRSIAGRVSFKEIGPLLFIPFLYFLF
jgi:hypothetical protein